MSGLAALAGRQPAPGVEALAASLRDLPGDRPGGRRPRAPREPSRSPASSFVPSADQPVGSVLLERADRAVDVVQDQRRLLRQGALDRGATHRLEPIVLAGHGDHRSNLGHGFPPSLAWLARGCQPGGSGAARARRRAETNASQDAASASPRRTQEIAAVRPANSGRPVRRGRRTAPPSISSPRAADARYSSRTRPRRRAAPPSVARSSGAGPARRLHRLLEPVDVDRVVDVVERVQVAAAGPSAMARPRRRPSRAGTRRISLLTSGFTNATPKSSGIRTIRPRASRRTQSVVTVAASRPSASRTSPSRRAQIRRWPTTAVVTRSVWPSGIGACELQLHRREPPSRARGSRTSPDRSRGAPSGARRCPGRSAGGWRCASRRRGRPRRSGRGSRRGSRCRRRRPGARPDRSGRDRAYAAAGGPVRRSRGADQPSPRPRRGRRRVRRSGAPGLRLAKVTRGPCRSRPDGAARRRAAARTWRVRRRELGGSDVHAVE